MKIINRVLPKLIWGLILFSILISDLGGGLLMKFADYLGCESCINKEEICLSYKESDDLEVSSNRSGMKFNCTKIQVPALKN